MVQLHGMSKGVDEPSEEKREVLPVFILKDFWLWGVVFLIVFILALCLPFESFLFIPFI